MLSHESQDKFRNSQIVKSFLTEKFNAIHQEHTHLDNLFILNGETWLVASSASVQGVELYNGDFYDESKLINELKKNRAGILIFQQFSDYELCIYLIDDFTSLIKISDNDLFITWEYVKNIKRFSEMGFVLDNEIIGFKTFRRARFESLHSLVS
jgi:hypothetical protein